MKRKSENALTNIIVQGKKTRKEYESKSNPSKQES